MGSGDVGVKGASQTAAVPCSLLGISGDCPAAGGPPILPPVVSNTVSNIGSTNSVMGGFWLVGWPRLRLAIASEVGETQPREAVSNKANTSAA